MQSTLAERLKEAMHARQKKVTGKALAQACGVAAPSVSDWVNGETKSLDGVNLVTAAEFLGVNPKWLATGLGPRDTADLRTVSIAYTQETAQVFGNPWPFELVNQARYESLTPAQKHQAQVRMMDEIEKLEVKTKRLTGT